MERGIRAEIPNRKGRIEKFTGAESIRRRWPVQDALGQEQDHFRYLRLSVFKAVGLRSQNNDRKGKVRDFLLEGQIFIHRQENIEFTGIRNQFETFSIFGPQPVHLANGTNVVTD